MKCQNCRHKIITELEDADCQPRDLTLRMKGKRETDDIILDCIEANKDEHKDKFDIALSNHSYDTSECFPISSSDIQ